MDYAKIGGRKWKVKILEITENFNIMDTDNAGRVIAEGAMTLDRIGTFFGHKVTFARRGNELSEYDELFDYLAQPRNNGINVDMIHGQTTINYKAYVSSGERKLIRIDTGDDAVYWDTFSANFIPMKAQVIPK